MSGKRSSRVTKPAHLSSSAPSMSRRRKQSYKNNSSAQTWSALGTSSTEYIEANHVSHEPQFHAKGSRLMNFKTDDKPFPIMELPAEIRLDIYRACLTRDRKLLLSKPDRSSQEASAEVASVSDGVSIGSGGESLSQGSEWDLIGPGAANRPWDPAPHRTRGTRSSSRVRDATARRLAAAAVAAVATRAVVVELPEPVDRHQESVNNDIEHDDRLVINILRTSKQIYREARDVLYSENRFELNIDTAVASLAALHQRNRRHIKHIELEIPTYTHILEGFSEIVRLSLRYCTGLQTFVMRTLFTLPGFDGGPVRGSTTVYANGFDILRWLPQTCRVVLEGNHNEEIEAVVQKHMNFASTQSKVAYARRQLTSTESDRNHSRW